MNVNLALLDTAKRLGNSQPMVESTRTFSDRFEQLRGGMSFQALSDAVFRKTGIRVSAQGMHKWTKGGGIEPGKIKLLADFFGVSEAWLIYGTGEPGRASIDQAVGALPFDERQQILDFIEYKIAKTEALVAGEKTVDYMKMIQRIRDDMKKRLDENGEKS